MNCRSHQISETVTRSNVGTNITPRSQQLVLINQRGCRIVSLKYVRNMCFYVFSLSLSQRVVCGCRPTLFWCWPTLAHTLILSLCLSTTLPFSLSFKRCCDIFMIIIEIQDSIVFGCSHFIKVALIRKKVVCDVIQCAKLIITHFELTETIIKILYYFNYFAFRQTCNCGMQKKVGHIQLWNMWGSLYEVKNV